MRRLIAAALAAGWVATGCAGLTSNRFATNDELRGPWRAEPMPVDPATIAAGEQVCAAQAGDAVRARRLVAVDARGNSRLTLLFVGPPSDSSECQLLMVAAGNLRVVGASGTSSVAPLEALSPDAVMITGGGQGSGIGTSEWSSVTGRGGSAVAVVRVVVPGAPTVRASVGGGWFTAWWPSTEFSFAVEGFDATGQKIGESTQ